MPVWHIASLKQFFQLYPNQPKLKKRPLVVCSKFVGTGEGKVLVKVVKFEGHAADYTSAYSTFAGAVHYTSRAHLSVNISSMIVPDKRIKVSV